MNIRFYCTGNIEINIKLRYLRKRFEKIAFFERFKFDCINFIFVSDRYIYILNKRFLQHCYPTDIISFSYSNFKRISGDLYISLDTVKHNANKLKIPYLKELYRVMIHGLLHLMNYDDKNQNEKNLIGKKESLYLKLLEKKFEFWKKFDLK